MAISDIAQIGPVMSARERILTTAYRLFTRRGIRAVGTDEVIAQSGVAKATLYRHFPSKNDLVLAVLQRREECDHRGDEGPKSARVGDPRLVLLHPDTDRRDRHSVEEIDTSFDRFAMHTSEWLSKG
jgi:AcrR family transcriptional regulator